LPLAAHYVDMPVNIWTKKVSTEKVVALLVAAGDGTSTGSPKQETCLRLRDRRA
jgi:hypothetical protein